MDDSPSKPPVGVGICQQSIRPKAIFRSLHDRRNATDLLLGAKPAITSTALAQEYRRSVPKHNDDMMLALREDETL